MKVVVAEVGSWEHSALSSCLSKHKTTFIEETFTLDDAIKYNDAELICIFIHSEIDEAIIKVMPKLKYIITRSTGFDHIDVAACKKRKIRVLNVPAYGTQTVAEHTFALMLALAKKIPKAIEQAKEGKWNIEGLQGVDLAGKTLGIVGLGKIGLDVAKKARAFDMKIIAVNPSKDKKIAKQFNLSYVSLPDLLNKSDFVTLHAPLTDQTRHMLNMSNIKQFKRGAFIINTARGELIETKALIEAIDKKIIAGAALDVLEGEQTIREEHELLHKQVEPDQMKQLLENHMLLKERNVLVTPHTAFYTAEALDRIVQTTCSNIKSCITGKPVNKVN